MEAATSPQKLLLQAEILLPHAVHPHLTKCCPTMDLIAFVTTDETIHVYRFGGQRAFSHQIGSNSLDEKDEAHSVVSLEWKFNGQCLAIAWSTGTVEIVSTEAGKLVQRFQQLYSSLASLHTDRIDVSCIGWALNFIDVASVKEKTSTNGTNRHAQNDTSNGLSSDDWDKKKTASSLDDFLERVPDAGKVEIPLDLPDQLSRLDICASFPRPALLMVLPPGAYKGGDHSDAELFSSQVSLDAALSTNTSHSVNGLEALMLAQDDGHIRLVFYDVLSIGYISLPESWKLEKVKYKGCAWNAFSSTYMFLMEYTEEAGKTKTALVPLSLRFLRSSGSQLHLIESKTAQLHTLVNYVGEAIIALGYHWDHAKELPTKFMDNINEELAREGFEDGLASKYKSKDPNLVQSLFHLAATGYCPPTLKEWLVDILAERGHKRWDHSIMNGYAKVRELVHTSILPALDRCAAILTHLRGLAIYHENSPIFNVPSPTFDSILEIIRCMRLLAHHVLLYYSEESRQFTTFSTWLRREIDTQASQTPPNPNEEAEQDLNIDFSLLLTYIQGALSESRLDKFVAVTYAADQINVAAGKYDECQRALENFKNGEETDNQLLRMSMHYQRWLRLNSEVLDQVTAHQRASSTFSDGIILQEGTVLVSDVDMYEEKGDDMVTTMTAMVLKDMRHQIHLSFITHDADFESKDSITQTSSVTIGLPPNHEICDLKIIDHGVLMFLIANKDSSNLIVLPSKTVTDFKNAATKTDPSIAPHLIPGGRALGAGLKPMQIKGADLQQYIKHKFEPNERFKPAKIEVNDRKNRRVVIVLGEDGRQVRILDLDYNEGDERPDLLGGEVRNGDGEKMEIG